MTSDHELLSAWSAGDKRAGNRLFQRYFEPIGRFFLSKVSVGVDDLVQRTFLALLERAGQLDEDTNVRAYLFGIARKTLLRRFRDQYRNGRYFDALATSVADLAESPSQLVGQQQQLQLLLAALREIPLDHQIVLELYFWEEMPARAIATVLEIPEGTVRSRIRRAKQLLAAEYEELLSGASSPQATQTRLDTWARSLRAQLFSE